MPETSPRLLPWSILAYCRSGFERECAGEIQAYLSQLGVTGCTDENSGAGYVVIETSTTRSAPEPPRGISFADLAFTRQLIMCRGTALCLTPKDRIGPIIARAHTLAPAFSELWLETADTNDGKAMSTFLRKFERPLKQAAVDQGLLGHDAKHPRLHVFFVRSTEAFVGCSDVGNSSPWPMGIPRLKFPRMAPSRSTLKLDEAILVFLGQTSDALQPGMRAVDLGAAPGGWTWQLVRRHLRVTAIDNGPLQPELLESGLVTHLRTDAFRYHPAEPVDWMVCDVVEQPIRIAELVSRWLVEGWCKRCIFNLKLPMKRRHEEVERCRALIKARLSGAGLKHTLSMKQLYHDREEITAFAETFTADRGKTPHTARRQRSRRR